ncbi:class I SAM-dependent methyltransferase [Roseibacterium sp. SDUM158017]|uniref:class I SAM-dependent methyltransferase n=1 Tax=Roseicyclus salinarum TaxID=3036773 RepID=UPI0024150146|nr:class I SAM-dependent methyltransferase [Roseibacterium sp. SDUM158017]MDG4647911.1 class I SAM-dependent methyltransferase [Roseibacterium sp. SDUM158017]
MTYEAFKRAEMEGWDARAAAYDVYTGKVTTAAIPTLLAMAETAPDKRFLDLCCGTGRAAGAASALGAVADGIDVSPAMVEYARLAFPLASFATGDAEAIPKPDDTYDSVICSFGVMHVTSPAKMLNEIARVLRPGGRLALSHWVGPPDSALFRIVFGTMQRLADMSVVPPSPPPFALSSEEAMRGALEAAGFSDVSIVRLPLTFHAPKGRFPEHFRAFAARAAVILDKQSDHVLREIYSDWEAQLEDSLTEDDQYHVPMPALAVSAVRNN